MISYMQRPVATRTRVPPLVWALGLAIALWAGIAAIVVAVVELL